MSDIIRCKSCVWYTKIDKNTGVCVWRLEPKTKNSCCPEWIPKGRRADEVTIHQYHERHKEVLKEMSMPVGRNVMDALRERRTDGR